MHGPMNVKVITHLWELDVCSLEKLELPLEACLKLQDKKNLNKMQVYILKTIWKHSRNKMYTLQSKNCGKHINFKKRASCLVQYHLHPLFLNPK